MTSSPLHLEAEVPGPMFPELARASVTVTRWSRRGSSHGIGSKLVPGRREPSMTPLLLLSLLRDPSRGRVYLFRDGNQDLWNRNGKPPWPMPRFPLRTNLRDTRAIGEYFSAIVGFDCRYPWSAPPGVEPEIIPCTTEADERTLAGRKIERLLNQGIMPDRIILIGTHRLEHSFLRDARLSPASASNPSTTSASPPTLPSSDTPPLTASRAWNPTSSSSATWTATPSPAPPGTSMSPPREPDTASTYSRPIDIFQAIDRPPDTNRPETRVKYHRTRPTPFPFTTREAASSS